MSTSVNKYDAIEQLIFDENIKIELLDIHPQQDVFIVVLNTKAVLRFSLSSYKALRNASEESLMKYQIIANGTGVHWPELDEDLSLKGFLQQELKSNIVKAA